MSSSTKYPRIDRIDKRKKNTSAKCRCLAVAKNRTHIQWNFMRGDDDVIWSCDTHKNDIDYLAGDGEQ